MYFHQWLTSCGVWLTNANILPMIVTLVVWASLNLCVLRLCCGLKTVPFCLRLQKVWKDAWLTVNFTGIITGTLPSTLFPVVWFCLLKQRESLYWWSFYENIISWCFFFLLIERRCARGRGDQWRYKLITVYICCRRVKFSSFSHLFWLKIQHWWSLNSLCLWQINLFPAEFDKFLEERAKAADSLPSPPGAHPAHPSRPPHGSHKKAERTEDALFAL